MAKQAVDISKSFREVFKLPDNNLLRWFPGHMHRGVLGIQHKLKTVDCVVEVHDSRIPFSGRNPRFTDIISMKPHVLILNKVDLIDKKLQAPIREVLKKQGIENLLFTDCKKERCPVINRDLIPMIMGAIDSRPRYNRQNVKDFNIMVIGVPNVGKSAFINSMRRGHTTLQKKATDVGGIPGVTRSVKQKIRVSHEPELFLIDTPGILTPNIPDIESGMKLSLCACLNDSVPGPENIVDYLLYWMNKHRKFKYLKYFDIAEPTDDKMKFLAQVAVKQKFIQKRKSIQTGQMIFMPDFVAASIFVLKAFRSGDLGKIVLDLDFLNLNSKKGP